MNKGRLPRLKDIDGQKLYQLVTMDDDCVMPELLAYYLAEKLVPLSYFSAVIGWGRSTVAETGK